MSKVTPIRPSQILSLEDGLPEELTFFFPPLLPGSMWALESLMLVKLLRYVKPAKLFEFGTFLGQTTRLLLENLPDVAALPPHEKRVYTLDLPDMGTVAFQGSDKALAERAIGAQRTYLASKRKDLVHQILIDSKAFDPTPYARQFQYVFIDANHEESYARRDTENALTLFAGEPGCIVWHDYKNPEFPELTAYLDSLSADLPLYHIEATMLVVHPAGFNIPEKRPI